MAIGLVEGGGDRVRAAGAGVNLGRRAGHDPGIDLGPCAGHV